jgi:hypothetical protein
VPGSMSIWLHENHATVSGVLAYRVRVAFTPGWSHLRCQRRRTLPLEFRYHIVYTDFALTIPHGL